MKSEIHLYLWPFYLVIVGTEMNTLWELHALILVDSPELAVVRLLALSLTDGSIEVVPRVWEP